MTEHDLHPDDIILSAYLDGELPAAEADALTRRLAAEPALMERLAALRTGDEAFRQAFASLDKVPLPQGVLGLLQDQATVGDVPGPGNHTIPFRSRAVREFLQWPVAIAACLALAVGFILSPQLTNHSGGSVNNSARYERVLPPGSELDQLLETGLSTQPVALDNGAVGHLVLTFQDDNGNYCRQLKVDAPASLMEAVACRHDDQWVLQVSTFSAPVAGTSTEGYQPATGNTAAAIDAVIDSLISDKPPLNAADESQLVNSGWNRK